MPADPTNREEQRSRDLRDPNSFEFSQHPILSKVAKYTLVGAAAYIGLRHFSKVSVARTAGQIASKLAGSRLSVEIKHGLRGGLDRRPLEDVLDELFTRGAGRLRHFVAEITNAPGHIYTA